MKNLIYIFFFICSVGYSQHEAMLLASQEQYRNETPPCDWSPLNTNPSIDPVSSAHRFCDNEANAVVKEDNDYGVIAVNWTSVADTSNGYGNYVAQAVSTTTGVDNRVRHRYNNGLSPNTTYDYFFIYRMISGGTARLKSFGANSNFDHMNLSSTTWATITGTITTNGTPSIIEIDVYTGTTGAIGNTIQYKLEIKAQ